jgi:hypothetical protein
MAVSFIDSADYIKVQGLAASSTGVKIFNVRMSSAGSGGKSVLGIGSASGTLMETCMVS